MGLFPIRKSSLSINEIVEKLQQVLLKAWFFMGVFAKSFIVVNLNSSWFLKDIFFKILVRN